MTRVWAWLRARLGLLALEGDGQHQIARLIGLNEKVSIGFVSQQARTEDILAALSALKAEITRRGDLADDAARRLDLRLGTLERRHTDDAEQARNDLRYLTRMTWGTTPPLRTSAPTRQPKQFTNADRQ